MFLKVCCGLKYSASFTSSFEQDDGITVLLQTPDLDNFFLVCIPMDVASITFSNPILFRATARASSPTTLPAYQTFLTTRQFEFAQQSPLSLQIRPDHARPDRARTAQTWLLRINKRVPTSPPVGTSQIPMLCHSYPPLREIHLRQMTPTPILRLFHPQRQTPPISLHRHHHPRMIHTH